MLAGIVVHIVNCWRLLFAVIVVNTVGRQLLLSAAIILYQLLSMTRTGCRWDLARIRPRFSQDSARIWPGFGQDLAGFQPGSGRDGWSRDADDRSREADDRSCEADDRCREADDHSHDADDLSRDADLVVPAPR